LYISPPETPNRDLRLDSLAAVRKGGKNGPVLKPGESQASPLLRRLLLPLDHDDHMPPDGKPQPTAAEIAVLKRCIDAYNAAEGYNAPKKKK
jgi:hypothetical protein